MDKNEKEILVIEKDILFGSDYFQGAFPKGDVDYLSRILTNKKWIKRGVAETDPTHKQPIGYAIIANPKTKQVFSYQRAQKDKDYGEKRLQGKWAIGVGGHIERKDSNSPDVVLESMLRELIEEVIIQGSINTRVLGYINDDSNDVGKVHFGILYLIETNAVNVIPKDPEITNGSMKPFGELEKTLILPETNAEEWTKLALPMLILNGY